MHGAKTRRRTLVGVHPAAVMCLVVFASHTWAQFNVPAPHVLDPAHGVAPSAVSSKGLITEGYDYDALGGGATLEKALLEGLDHNYPNTFLWCGGPAVFAPCMYASAVYANLRTLPPWDHANTLAQYGFSPIINIHHYSIRWTGWMLLDAGETVGLCGPVEPTFGQSQDDAIDVVFGAHPRDMLSPSVISRPCCLGSILERQIHNPATQALAFPFTIFGSEVTGSNQMGLGVLASDGETCVNFDNSSSPVTVFRSGPAIPQHMAVGVYPGPVWREGDTATSVNTTGASELESVRFAIRIEDAANALPAVPDTIALDGAEVLVVSMQRTHDAGFTTYSGFVFRRQETPLEYVWRVEIAGAARSPYVWRGHAAPPFVAPDAQLFDCDDTDDTDDDDDGALRRARNKHKSLVTALIIVGVFAGVMSGAAVALLLWYLLNPREAAPKPPRPVPQRTGSRVPPQVGQPLFDSPWYTAGL